MWESITQLVYMYIELPACIIGASPSEPHTSESALYIPHRNFKERLSQRLNAYIHQRWRKAVEIGEAPMMVVHKHAHARGVSGPCSPRKIRCSEIASEAIFVPKCH